MGNQDFKDLEGPEPRESRIRNKILPGLPYFKSTNLGGTGSKVNKVCRSHLNCKPGGEIVVWTMIGTVTEIWVFPASS